MPAPEDAPARVGGVVLAAGSSQRLGQNKLLLPLGGETVVRRAVTSALDAGLGPVAVVLGHEADLVRRALAGLPCRIVLNEKHAIGVGSSVRAGVAAIAAEVDALVVVLADMPFVTAAMIEAVIAQKRATGAALVVSRYGEVDAPPMLYDRALFAELLGIADDQCAKQVVRRHRAEAAAVEWPEGALRDIDVVEDYEHARAHLGQAAGAG
jgi:molybdenum cofactor cytidylyltransferase